MVRLTTQSAEGCFEMQVTADHEIVVRGPSDCPVAVQARDLVAHPRDIFSGRNDFQPLASVQLLPNMQTRVVHVSFQGEEDRVVAWLLPRGRRRPPELKKSAAFCCMGSMHTLEDKARQLPGVTLREERTFLEVEPKKCPCPRSALSEGARPRSAGAWSIGSELHPNHCRACPFHLRRSCQHGAGCNMCHHPSHTRSRARHA